MFRLNKDGSGYNVLHRFENYADGAVPRRLAEGLDGSLYGTTAEGGRPGWGTIFRLNRDGSDYGVLYDFGATETDGRNPEAGLVKGTDGAFYGTTSGGGDLRQGTLFRLLPPQTPSMLGAHLAGGVAFVSFSGVGGYRYEVSLSTDLAHWTALAAIVMPPDGVYTNLDRTPPDSAAFYRAAWLP